MSKVERDCLRILRHSAPVPLAVTLCGSRRWASALFAGYRLTVTVKSDDDARLDEWLIALPELELAWPGHFIASAEVIGRSANIGKIELLVVED